MVKLFKFILFFSVVLILIGGVFAGAGQAAPDDYDSYPEQQFRFHHLEGELTVTGNPVTIAGTVRYTMSAYLAGYDEVVLNAVGLDIERVTKNGTTLSYETRNDSLHIELDEVPERDDEFELAIQYRTEPNFGVYRSARGTIRTSTLPASNRHWLPAFDHPRGQVTTDLTFIVNEDKTAVTGGVRDGVEMTGDGMRRVNWQSEYTLPLSEIGFVVGRFQHMDALFGIRRIRVFAEEAVFSEDRMEEILQQGHNRLRRVESELGHSFPYDEFSVVMMEEDHWEPRSFAAGMGWIFEERGAFEPQLYHGLYSQWYGINKQVEQWQDASAIQGYQSFIADRFGDGPVPEIVNYELVGEPPETNYDSYSTASLNRNREWFTEYDDAIYTTALRESALQLLDENREVYSWRDFADIWYRNTGRLWTETPEIPYIAPEDTLRFIASINFSASAGRMTFDFDPVDHATDRSVPAVIKLYRGGEVLSQEVDIPGRGGEVRISSEEPIHAAYVERGRHQPVRVQEDKSISMWLYQLRNAEDAFARKDAAVALRQYEDNTDLQLAVRDLLTSESDPGVLAELYRTFGVLTGGASGTQSVFIDGLNHSEREVQMASLEALADYEDNSTVINEVFEIISLSEDIEKVYKAVGVYRRLNPEDEFVDFLDRFLSEDEEALEFTPGLIDALFETDSLDYAVERTQRYLEPDYPFNIRHKVWYYLTEHDGSAEAWQARVEHYLHDPDPRMRMLALSQIHRFGDEQITEWLGQRERNEYDARVLRRIDELQN